MGLWASEQNVGKQPLQSTFWQQFYIGRRLCSFNCFFVRGVQGAQLENKIMQNRWSRYHIPLSMLSSPQPRLLPLRAHKGLPAVWWTAPNLPARQPGLPHSIQPERGWAGGMRMNLKRRKRDPEADLRPWISGPLLPPGTWDCLDWPI